MPRCLHLTADHVARVPRYSGPPLPPPDGVEPATEADHQATLQALLATAPPGDGTIRVFAYGSLIWNPGCEVAGEEIATAPGWHRSFCLGWMTSFRGCPDRPGLMMALDRGGSCRGVVLRLPPDPAQEGLLAIIRRETPYKASAIPPRWLALRGAAGRLRAIGFPIDRRARAYVPGLSEDAVVAALATSAGDRGTMAEYLHNTVQHLEDRGIHDRRLWRLQQRVAARIDGAA